jgi:tRNA (Thr-GGU) A37 N-methylase
VGKGKGKIRVPRVKLPVGVFATRSPHRPNAIGLSLCRIESVDCNVGRLVLSGIDLVQGTGKATQAPHERLFLFFIYLFIL